MAADGKCQDGDVDGAGSEAVEKDGCNLLDDGESNLGEFARERSKARREEVGSDGGNNTNVDRTADEILAFDDVASGGFQFAKDGAGAWEKRLAKLGKPNGAAEAVEEASAQFVLELHDLLGERRLGNVGLFGSAAERAGFSHRAEVTKLVKFHRLCLSIVSELYIGSIGRALLRLK